MRQSIQYILPVMMSAMAKSTRTSAKKPYPFPNPVRIQVAFYQALCFLVPRLLRLVGTEITDEKLNLQWGTVHGPVLVSL
jgi:hypothetical protein